MTASLLTNRAVIRLSGEDPRGFLQGLVTNDVGGALPVWAALLTPQGKVIADFLIWADGDDLLIDCEADAAEALVKRLSIYRLRRAIAIAVEPKYQVNWSIDPPTKLAMRLVLDSGPWPPSTVRDPRLASLGYRWIGPSLSGEPADEAWLAHRLSLGVCEGITELGDLLWLECNAAELDGVSFTKGCYVGQENTARMNWRQKVNRRLVVVPFERSDPARQRAAYPSLGLAVDHLRVEDIAADLRPDWLQAD